MSYASILSAKQATLLSLAVTLFFLSTTQAQQIPGRPRVEKPSPSNLQQPMQHDSKSDRQQPQGFFNLPMLTTGGQQFWTDHIFRGGWRIQRNSETGHFRLINADEVRQAWGNLAHCKQKLSEFEAAGALKPQTGRVVILLHGLIRTSHSMDTLEKHLRKNGYGTVNFRYASSRQKVGEHAIALKSVIDNLDEKVTDLFVVAHSLGNIVTRRYLADNLDSQTNRQGDPRLRRMVMIGPPNQGSKVARLMKHSLLFNTIAGKSGAQLAATWDKLEPTLATPSIEFGIIAGGQQDGDWSNFVLKGKDDYTVSVEETKLVGAKDSLVRPLLHSNMMAKQEVLDATVSFFENGYFISESARNPIEK